MRQNYSIRILDAVYFGDNHMIKLKKLVALSQFCLILYCSTLHAQEDPPKVSCELVLFETIVETYYDNPVRAKQLYGDKKSCIYGRVTSIENSFLYIFVYFGKGEKFQIQFPKSEQEHIAKLKLGDGITIHGYANRFWIGTNVIVKDVLLLRINGVYIDR